MKHVISVLTALTALLMLTMMPCAAADGFYCEYTPKSERSSVFYIDLCSADEVSAAVMELTFDPAFVEYRDTTAAEKSTSVRAACENGCVKLAFADSVALKGKLCRVAFKAIQAGAVTFTLQISQASDGEVKMLSGFSDYTLSVELGKDDVASSPSKTSSASSEKGYTSRSVVSGGLDDDEDTDASVLSGGVFDLRRSHALTYILIGAGAVLLIAALVFAGVLLGRRSVLKNKPASNEKADKEPDAIEEIIGAERIEDVVNDDSPIE